MKKKTPVAYCSWKGCHFADNLVLFLVSCYNAGKRFLRILRLDSFTNLASIPVDLLRQDWLSAGLDLFGVIPFIGEVADAAKIVNKGADVVKAANKALTFADMPKAIHVGKQGKHIIGHNNYTKGKSILSISISTAQDLINKYSGTGIKVGTNREMIDFKTIIGKFITSADTYMGHELLLKWPDSSQIRANYVSYIEDETDCDMDSADYEEYWSFVFEMCSVDGEPPVHITEDNYFMVSYHNFPTEILSNGVKLN